jgi:guanylate kinase
MNKSEKIILLGKSGSGKDYLTRKLIEKGLKPCIKTTTRPMRINEIQNVSYNFIDDSKFESLLNDGRFLFHQTFLVTPTNKSPQKWYYGITKEEFNNSQVFIMTPGEISQIEESDRKKCFVVYLDIDRKVREQRLSFRNDQNDSIKRRLDADELDFLNFKDYDLKITDPEFTANEVYELMD